MTSRRIGVGFIPWCGALLLGSCGGANGDVVRDDWRAGGCPVPSDSPTAPSERTSGELVAAYGAPAGDDRFVLGEVVDLGRMTVRDVLTGPAASREVRELIWRRDGCELFIWFARRGGKWVAVQTFRTEQGGER